MEWSSRPVTGRPKRDRPRKPKPGDAWVYGSISLERTVIIRSSEALIPPPSNNINYCDSDNEEQEHKPPPPKRRRLAKDDPLRKIPYKPRKPGTLKKLMDMPFDILYEVFGHLDPIDLLQLSRSAKSMRTMLLTRSTAVSIWRTSLGRYPKLLDLHPSDMAEPAFAYLMFGKNCHICLRNLQSHALNRDYRLRTKICSRCLISECDKPNGTFIGELKDMPEYNDDIGYPKNLWEKRPSILVPSGSQTHREPDERYIRAVSAELDARWAKEYAEAEDKHTWVEEKLKEVKAASLYHIKCLEWMGEHVTRRLGKAVENAYLEYSDDSDWSDFDWGIFE